MHRLLFAALLALAAAGGCQTTAASQAAANSLTGSTPLIPPLPPLGADSVPPAIIRAQASFVEGALAYGSGSFADAAVTFLRVADELVPEKDGAFADELATNRLFAYRNAALSFLLAGAPDQAQRALRKRASGDPRCEVGIQEILAALPPMDGGVDDEPDGGAAPTSEDAGRSASDGG